MKSPEKRFACFADTPLHVLNCLNFIWHDVEGSRNHCDLYIHKQFLGYDNMIGNLRKSGIFSHIYECTLPIKRDEGKLAHSVFRIVELFFPRYFFHKWSGRKANKNEYDVLLMPAPLRFSIALAALNKKAEVWFYEDGSVNYFGDILSAYGPKYKHLIKVLFNKGHETVVPKRMYLNNVELSNSKTDCPKIQLPSVAESDIRFRELLVDTFGESRVYEDRKYIYLSIPQYDISAGDGVNVPDMFEKTLQPLVSCADRTIIRPHPREPERDYCGLEADRSRTLWELICAKIINDHHVLIGAYSTAQMMPKIMYDKEPVLIFNYKVYQPTIPEERQEEMDALVERLRSHYRNPERIVNVRDIDEYLSVIARITSGKVNNDGE